MPVAAAMAALSCTGRTKQPLTMRAARQYAFTMIAQNPFCDVHFEVFRWHFGQTIRLFVLPAENPDGFCISGPFRITIYFSGFRYNIQSPNGKNLRVGHVALPLLHEVLNDFGAGFHNTFNDLIFSLRPNAPAFQIHQHHNEICQNEMI